MNIKWNQSGMPTTLVSRLGRRNEFAEFKSVIREAQDQVMSPVDAEAMARELVDGDGRAYVDMVRELSSELKCARRELEEANRKYGSVEGQTLVVWLLWWGCAEIWYNSRYETLAQLQARPVLPPDQPHRQPRVLPE